MKMDQRNESVSELYSALKGRYINVLLNYTTFKIYLLFLHHILFLNLNIFYYYTSSSVIASAEVLIPLFIRLHVLLPHLLFRLVSLYSSSSFSSSVYYARIDLVHLKNLLVF